MFLLRTAHFPLKFEKYSFTKMMMDYVENLEGWLEDATLFPNEPFDVLFNFDDDLTTAPKANNGSGPLVSNLSSPRSQNGDEWLDEKVDLSIFDYPSSLLIEPNEAETQMIEEAATILESLMDDNIISYLPMDENDDLKIPFDLDVVKAEDNLDSPYPCNTDSPYPCIIDSPYPGNANSPNPCNTDSPYPCNTDSPYPYSPVSSVASPVSVTSNGISVIPYDANSDVEDDIPRCGKSMKILSIEDISTSMKKKKFVNSGKDVPSVRVSLRQASHPYGTGRRKAKKENRYERKKVQNKEAAARYRIKKRNEEMEISGVVEDLEKDQKVLQDKHDQLAMEIKYLKSLMQEMFRAKGILK